MAASSAGKGWGRHRGAFKITLVPLRVVPGRGGADIGVPLNYSSNIEIPLKYN